VRASRPALRPIAFAKNAATGAFAGSIASGIQTPAVRSGNPKSAGMTPITTVMTPFMSIDWPTMPGSLANFERHSPSLRISTGVEPGLPSSSVNVRPRAADTPRTGKNVGETAIPSIRSGSPFTTRLPTFGRCSATSASVFDRSRYNR
jgi:hypothetical protein